MALALRCLSRRLRLPLPLPTRRRCGGGPAQLPPGGYGAWQERAARDPAAFWAEAARGWLRWDSPFHTACEAGWDGAGARWFLGGRLNVSGKAAPPCPGAVPVVMLCPQLLGAGCWWGSEALQQSSFGRTCCLKGAGAQSLLLAVAVLPALSLFRVVSALSALPYHGQAPSSETKPQPYLGHNSVLRSSNRDVYFRIKPPCFSTKEQTLPWASQNTREDSQLWSSQGNRAVCTALLPAHRLQPNSCFQCFPLKGRSWLSKGLFRIH